MLETLLLQTLNGFVWGSVLALIALGLTLIYGLLMVVNVSHGVFYTFGAVLTWYWLSAGQNFWLGVVGLPLVVGVIGVVSYLGVIRPIENNWTNTIIVTIGLQIIFQHLVLMSFGGSSRSVESPFPGVIPVFGFGYPIYRIVVAAVTWLLVAVLFLLLYWSKWGVWVRAIKHDWQIAAALGIPVPTVRRTMFFVGSMLAGLGGVLAAPMTAIDFRMGETILMDAFIVVIVGGLGSFEGTVLAAVAFKVFEGAAATYVTPVIAKVVALLGMIGFIYLRPEGILGER